MLWLSNWKEKRRLKRRREGWDFAAGMLLEDPIDSKEKLSNHIADAHAFGTWDEFDEGVVAALREHERQKS